MKDIRPALLRTGMGCFAFTAGISLLNVLFLPYARANYGYSAAVTLGVYAVSLGALILAGRSVGRMEEEKAERAAKALAPVFLAALFMVQLVVGYWMEYTPSGDNFMLYNGSQMLARDGSFDAYPDFGLYLSRFSNQWGFLLMLTALFRALGALGVTQFFFPLVVLQAGLYVLGMRSALRIARRLGGARAEILTVMMLAVCLPLVLAAGVLYTDTFSLPFILMALDLALCARDAGTAKGQIGYAAVCGAVTLIGCQIKMTVLIALIAAGIIWLMAMKPMRSVVSIALCGAMIFAGTTAVKGYMLGHVLDPKVYAQEHTPVIHWVMMSIPTSDNPYGGSTGDYGITWGMMDEGATHEEVMESIYARMKDRIYTLRYPDRLMTAALRKNSAFMGDGTFGMTEMLDDGPVRENAISAFVLEGRPFYRGYSAVCTGIWMAQWTLALLACIRDIRKWETDAAMLYIAVFGVTLFLMLWEARGRYLFGFVPAALLLAARGALPQRGERG